MTYEKKQEKNKLVFNITVEANEFKEFLDRALESIAKEVEIKGFRKGHAPLNIVKQNIDPSLVLSKGVEDCISNKWFEILNKENIEAICQPNIEVLKMAEGNPLEFKAEVEVLPEVKLPDYKKLASEVKDGEIKVEEKEYEDAISWLLSSRAKFFQKDGAAEKGDLIEITYTAKDLDGGKEKKDRFILGKGHYIDGLEEKLLGLKREDEKEIEVVSPENEKKKIVLNIKVDSVQEMETPELNDEFAKGVGFENVKKLEESIRNGLQKEKEMAEKQRKRTEILEKIVKSSKLEAPQPLIEREVDVLLQNLKNRTSYELQMTFDEYLKQIQKTEDQVRKEFEKIAEERVKGFLVLHEIEKKENINVSSEEINKRIEELAAEYPDKNKAKEEMMNSNVKYYIEDELRRDKIFNILGC
ncbi:MAG: trigger factor [Candidatus Pacebacteria bacterium]|nr:trigger factor [Candidatus Paceibacterota bacterium]